MPQKIKKAKNTAKTRYSIKQRCKTARSFRQNENSYKPEVINLLFTRIDVPFELGLTKLDFCLIFFKKFIFADRGQSIGQSFTFCQHFLVSSSHTYYLNEGILDLFDMHSFLFTWRARKKGNIAEEYARNHCTNFKPGFCIQNSTLPFIVCSVDGFEVTKSKRTEIVKLVEIKSSGSYSELDNIYEGRKERVFWQVQTALNTFQCKESKLLLVKTDYDDNIEPRMYKKTSILKTDLLEMTYKTLCQNYVFNIFSNYVKQEFSISLWTFEKRQLSNFLINQVEKFQREEPKLLSFNDITQKRLNFYPPNHTCKIAYLRS